MKLIYKLGTVKVRLDGKNKSGANTCRQFHVADTDVDELAEFLQKAVTNWSAEGGKDGRK